MADFFVDSNASGSNDGSNWANAFNTFAAGVSALSVSDRIIIANVSAQSLSSNETYTFAGDNVVITSTVSGSNTITSIKAVSKQIDVTGSNDLTFNGNNTNIFGMSISGRDVKFNDVRTEDCDLFADGTSGSAGANLGTSVGDARWVSINDKRKNEATNASGAVIQVVADSVVIFQGGTIESDRVSVSANHTALEVLQGATMIADGVDCNGFTLPKLTNGGDLYNTLQLTRFRLNAATTTLLNVMPSTNGQVATIDCVDSSNTVNRQYTATYHGELFSDTSIILDATNPDGDTISNKIVSNSKVQNFFVQARFLLAAGWADFSTSKTLTVEIVQDGTTTALNDDEFWIEVQYPDDTTSAYHVESDRSPNSATVAAQEASTATWTGLSGTNVKQKCSVTTTNTGKQGPYQVFVCLAKPSTTVYANPKIDIA